MLTIENVIDKRALRLERADVHLHESASRDDLPHVTPPVNIIQDDQTAYAHFVWTQRGYLTKMLSRQCTWECRVYLEKMGMGEATNPAPSIVKFEIGDGHRYNTYIPLNGLQEGAYKMVATLLFRGPNNAVTPIAAFEELGVLQVYRDA